MDNNDNNHEDEPESIDLSEEKKEEKIVPLVNFKKMRYIASIIRQIEKFQKVPYCLDPVPSIQNWISNIHEKVSLKEDEYYDQSCKCEARQNRKSFTRSTSSNFSKMRSVKAKSDNEKDKDNEKGSNKPFTTDDLPLSNDDSTPKKKKRKSFWTKKIND
eukprot:TRINITY_DN6330_c0_g1_i1.p1 TRINITY_DN6330_c0_g1~~TRINITY_DN6330_c0_g1_i1.p1  ORF type:complete len:181 (-),score=74.38 TRINITY_DN6330_c0_g1_i1:141-617(-)